mmetsp:Transcript_30267/g.66200  ORF Transcript_30267/g.66200 Transcript_30267/m.66200 type:complete len:209 (-) Transcript_30267:1144-1770(-)
MGCASTERSISLCRPSDARVKKSEHETPRASTSRAKSTAEPMYKGIQNSAASGSLFASASVHLLRRMLTRYCDKGIRMMATATEAPRPRAFAARASGMNVVRPTRPAERFSNCTSLPSVRRFSSTAAAPGDCSTGGAAGDVGRSLAAPEAASVSRLCASSLLLSRCVSASLALAALAMAASVALASALAPAPASAAAASASCVEETCE